MITVQRCVPRGMVLAFAATLLLFLASPAAPQGSPPDLQGVVESSRPLSEAELAAAIGGKPAYCDKALVSCMESCGNWWWLGQVFVTSCNGGCIYGYSQCGGAG